MSFMLSCKPSSSVVALVDCNNFFVSCERLFEPGLANKPVVVLSNNDGCIISRSNEAKALGIKMGEPLFKARPIVEQHNVRVFSSNFRLYGDLSRRVMRTLETITPQVEIYSVDEAFLDLTGESPGALAGLGRDIQTKVLKWTGIPVSIGIAETKTLAKLATELAKKSSKAKGVLSLVESPYRELALSRVPVRDVWGVGRRLADDLTRNRIHTALDLAQASDDWLMRRYSVVLMRTVMELRGIACDGVDDQPTASKSIISSRSFGTLVEQLPDLKEAVAAFTAKAAEKLRYQGMAAWSIEVYIRTHRFHTWEEGYQNSITVPLPTATDDTGMLIQHALQGVEAIYKPGFKYHKAGVMLFGLVPRCAIQQQLFYAWDAERSQRLMQAMDRLNSYFGNRTVFYGAEGRNSRWSARCNIRSQEFTTAWKELLTIS